MQSQRAAERVMEGLVGLSAALTLRVLITSCRTTIGRSSPEIVTNQRVWLDGNGNLQLAGRVTISGVTAALHSTYVRQGAIIFDLGA